MRALAALPVELLQIIAGYICAGAAAKAARSGAPNTGPASLGTVGFDFFDHGVNEDEADPESENEMENGMAAEEDESDGSSVETADEMDVASIDHSSTCSTCTTSTTQCVAQVVCDLAALSLTDRYLHRVFNPLLYQWDRDHATRAVSWAIRRNSLATLEKALSLGLDVNAKIYPFSREEEAGWEDEKYRRLRPIEQALRKGSEASLEWLLKHGATVDGPVVEGFPHRTTDEYSALLLAQKQYKNEDAALILLDHGASVFFAGEKYWDDDDDDIEVSPVETALHNAAELGHARVVERLLLEHTIDINVRDTCGMTPLCLAVGRPEDSTAIVELLFQHGASSPEEHMLPQMLLTCHPQNLAFLARTQTDYPRDLLHNCLIELGSRLEAMHPYGEVPTYDDIPSWAQDVVAILSKLVESGADFNYPPPRYATETEPLVSEVSRDFDPFLFRTLVELGANPLTKLHARGNSLNIDLASGARMDVKDPVTGQTIFEAAVDLCNDDDEPGHECLQFALEHRNPENLASSHIYEVLESGLAEKKFEACVRIMRHGWVSRTAQSYVFDWLISYATRIEASGPDGTLDWMDPEERLAIGFFPWFLDRQQLDELWKQALAFYHACASEMFTVRWRQLPWWHINAERGDVEAIQMLCSFDMKHPSAWAAETDRESRVPTALMRAASAGHRDVALFLLKEELVSSQDMQSRCDHLSRDYGHSACVLCPDGLLSLPDLLLRRGEIEVLEALLNCEELPKDDFSYYVWEEGYVPRVLSYGNLTAEWLELKESLSTNCEYSLFPEEERYRRYYWDDSFDTIGAEMDGIKKKMSSLRMEIAGARDAWLERAEGIKRENGSQEVQLVPDGKDRVPDGENVRDDPLRATDTTSVLYSALEQKCDNEDAALLLLDHGARVFFAKDLKSDDWMTSVETALHIAAKHGRTRVVRRLLHDGTIPVDMRNPRGRTPFGLAVTNCPSVAATVEVLLQYTTDPFADSKAMAAALKKGHQEHIILMLRTKFNYSHSLLYTFLKQLNFRLGHRCLFDKDCDDRGYGGYDDSLNDKFFDDIDYANPDPTPAMEVSAILAKLVEFGADFDNPPPALFKDEHEPLVSMASRHLDPFIFKTLVELGANPLIRLQQKCDAFDMHLDSNARMDFKIPATGQTIFEAAVDLCDETSKPDCGCLQYLPAQATPDKLASSHVYEVLESRIVHFEKHINGCIAIMQQGWISSVAQSYIFDWLIAYITGKPVMRSGLRYDWANVELNKKAAKFFPQFLNRERLDEFWRTSQAWESPCELAINRGEIELLDVMFENGIVEREYSRARAPDLPRVLSHGNVMAERLELKVLFEAYCDWEVWEEADCDWE
ncbi:hypothetical protein LQW54_009588 [Pestalotiopsis sp. IQ-011]